MPLVPAFFVALLSLCVGSFVNVLISRLPDPTRTLFNPPRSACPHCNGEIGALDNIPVVSWLWLKGRCRHCGAGISALYPAIEIAVMLFGLIAYWCFLHGLAGGVGAVMLAIYLTLLIAIAVTDMQTYLIPDFYTVGGTVLFVALWFYAGGLVPARMALLDALVAGFGLYAFGNAMSLLLKKEALGTGDAFLVALIASFSGFGGAMLSIYLGAVSGVIVHVAMKYTGHGPVGTPAWLAEETVPPDAPLDGVSGEVVAAYPTPSEDAPIKAAMVEADLPTDAATLIPFGLHLAVGAALVLLFAQQLAGWTARLNGFLPWHPH